jgi:hypothetical protein
MMDIDITTIKGSVVKHVGLLGDVEASRIAQVIAVLLENGISVDDVFPFGVTEAPDAISIRANLQPTQLAQLADIIPKLESMKDYRVFSRGIIAPESYRLHLNLRRENIRP